MASNNNKGPFVAFGISLGNSSCCIAVNRNGNADVVANASGERVTPSVVGFHETEVVTGIAAKQGLVRHDKASVVGALRVIGSTAQDEITFPLNLSCQISYDTKRPRFVIQYGDRNKMVVPEEALKHLFILLKDIAASYSREEKLPLIITVPCGITDSSISVVHNAANAAGFRVLKTISQPSAACLAYDLLNDDRTTMNVLIFHCGGTSIVATVAEISGGLLSIKETSYSLTASGDAITSILVDHFAKEFFMKYKGDPLENRRSKRKLYNVSENCKHVLSTMTSAQVHAESLWEGVDFSTQLSRARFDGLIASTLTEFLAPIREVLQNCNLDYGKIDKVILTGGSCKIPKLQNIISEMFKSAEILKRFPADEILALGAAKETSFYVDKESTLLQTSSSLLSCLSVPIYIQVSGGKGSECLFSNGTPTHTRKSLSLECPTGPCNLIIYEGIEAVDVPGEDQILAQVELNFIDSSNSVTLQIDCLLKSEGSLLMKLVELSSKTNKSFIIEAGQS